MGLVLGIDTSNYNNEELSCLKEQAKTIIVENQTIKKTHKYYYLPIAFGDDYPVRSDYG